MISVSNLSKSIIDGAQTKSVLEDVSFVVEQGQSLSITGESGAGKSTLLHLIAALDKPDDGIISVNGLQLDKTLSDKQADSYRKTLLGMVFQQFNLIDCLSVWDNISFTARINGVYDQDYIQHLLEQLDITRHQAKLPVELSGGEQQRVSVARALAHRPKILLADEPTGNLDDKNSELVSELLFSLCASTSTSFIIVTHSQEIARKANKHLHLSNGKLHAID
ncbi:ABC transporter ATP-binding protein [Alteromonadaceae bacterium M269]|nr:ABC transporter ATP-binding protein [Alteromonadaceae bacterium M269]